MTKHVAKTKIGDTLVGETNYEKIQSKFFGKI